MYGLSRTIKYTVGMLPLWSDRVFDMKSSSWNFASFVVAIALGFTVLAGQRIEAQSGAPAGGQSCRVLEVG